MSRHARVAVGLGLLCSLAVAVRAADPHHDFSGKWTLDAAASRLQGLTIPADPVLTIVQQETAIHSSTNATYALDGSETKYKIGDTRQSSAVKWEGAALLINTLVSGPRDYTVMDRWKLSPDRGTLTITRQVVERTGQSEGVLVYRGDNWRAPAAAAPLPGRAPERTPERAPEINPAAAEAPRPDPDSSAAARGGAGRGAGSRRFRPALISRWHCAIRWIPSTPRKATGSIWRPFTRCRRRGGSPFRGVVS